MGVHQKLMRHAHVSTTMDQYGNASAVEKRKAQSADRQAGPRKGNESAGLDSIIKGNCGQFPYWTVLDSHYTRTETKSGVRVSIAKQLPGDLDVRLGGSKPIAAIVTGTGLKENTVTWRISGFGCSGSACGELTEHEYHAPTTALPNPLFVTLMATSKADPSAKASITLHIFEEKSQ